MFITNQQSLSDIIQENLVNGRLFIRAAARLMGVSDKALIMGGNFKSQKLAQILTEHGFEAGNLVENGLCAQSFWLTVEYFAYDSKAKAAGAKQLARTFGQIGVMTAFERLEAKPIEVKPELTAFEKIDYAVKLEGLKEGYIKELLRDMMVAELSQAQLAPAKVEYTTVKVRAQELGFSVKQIGSGGQLGKWVKSHLEPSFTERVGKYDTNHYELSPRLDEVIDSFFR